MWLTCLINLFQTNLPEDGNGEVELTHETEHLSSPDIEVSSHLSPRPFIFNQSTHVSFIDGYLGELYCLTIPKFCQKWINCQLCIHGVSRASAL